MRNIFKDIHFDEDGDAELTQLIANDFFIAPSNSLAEAKGPWQGLDMVLGKVERYPSREP